MTGLVLPRIDTGISAHAPFIFPGGPDGARSALGTIASAMIPAARATVQASGIAQKGLHSLAREFRGVGLTP